MLSGTCRIDSDMKCHRRFPVAGTAAQNDHLPAMQTARDIIKFLHPAQYPGDILGSIHPFPVPFHSLCRQFSHRLHRFPVGRIPPDIHQRLLRLRNQLVGHGIELPRFKIQHNEQLSQQTQFIPAFHLIGIQAYILSGTDIQHGREDERKPVQFFPLCLVLATHFSLDRHHIRPHTPVVQIHDNPVNKAQRLIFKHLFTQGRSYQHRSFRRGQQATDQRFLDIHHTSLLSCRLPASCMLRPPIFRSISANVQDGSDSRCCVSVSNS